MAADRIPVGLDDRDAFAVPTVVHIDTPSRLALDGNRPNALPVEKAAQDPTAFTGENAAHRDLHAHAQKHAGLPHTLAAGVEVDVGAVGMVLHRDRQDGRWREYDDFAHAVTLWV